MAVKAKRTLISLGGRSRLITLPCVWVDFYGMQKGDAVLVLGNSILVICRPEDEAEARRLLLKAKVDE